MVVILLANGFEEVEALAPLDIMLRGGLPVKTVGIGGKTVTGAHGIAVEANLVPGDVDEKEIDMLLLPGGMPGTVNLEQSPVTHSYIDAVIKNSGHISAICAAPSILGHRGLLNGKRAICFPGFEDELKGAVVCCTDSVVTDGNITTAKDFRAAYALGDELVAIYKKMKGIKDNAPTGGGESDNAYVARTINETYASFGVAATVESYIAGPRFNSYDIRIGEKTKASKIQSLFADVCLNLGRDGIRMISPNKTGGITLEVPRKKPEAVSWRSLVTNDILKNNPSPTAFVYGVSATGEPIYGDIARLPHAIVAGATGMGKSVFINSLLASVISRSTPEQVRLMLIDPKTVEFYSYTSCPHRLCPVINDPWDAAGALAWAVEEMERRYDILENASARNIDYYNKAIANDPSIGEPMYRIIIVIDELNDLMIQAKTPTEDLIMRIAQKSRAVGIHLIIGTQRPSVDVLTGTVRANIPSRICFKVASATDSRVALDMAGACHLLNNGDMLIKMADKPMPIRAQGAFISDGEVEEILADAEAKYPNADVIGEATAGIIKSIQKVKADYIKPAREAREEVYIPSDDRIFLDAVELAIQNGRVTISMLQRKLSIGYSRAAYYISVMEDLEILASKRGAREKETVITLEEWKSRLQEINRGEAQEAVDQEEDDKRSDALALLADDRFIEAALTAIRLGKASTSLLQRKLFIGFGTAAKYIDALEELGVIAPPDGQRPRKVLMNEEQWTDFVLRQSKESDEI